MNKIGTQLAKLPAVFLILFSMKKQAQDNALDFDGVDDYVSIT